MDNEDRTVGAHLVGRGVARVVAEDTRHAFCDGQVHGALLVPRIEVQHPAREQVFQGARGGASRDAPPDREDEPPVHVTVRRSVDPRNIHTHCA